MNVLVTSDDEVICSWFVRCSNVAQWATRGPIGGGGFGMVPICQRCADKVGIPAEELYEYELVMES